MLRRLIAKILGPVSRAGKAGSVADGVLEARGRPPRWLDKPGLGSSVLIPRAVKREAAPVRARGKPDV